ncbi:MAG: MBG domain-containing protein [Acidobacteriota bacterium]
MTTRISAVLATAMLAGGLLAAQPQDGLWGGGAAMWQQGSGGLPETPDSLQGSYGGPGTPADEFGSAVATGDFDGDGFDDVVIGVPGEDSTYVAFGSTLLEGFRGRGAVHVLYGSAEGPGAHRNSFIRSTDVSPDTDRDSFGQALAAGDFNGDGYADLAVGAPHWGSESPSHDGYGRVYVFWGSAAGLSASSHRAITRLVGIRDEGDQWGAALAAGDFDLNGFDDLVIGMPGASTGAVIGHGAIVIIYRGSHGGDFGDLRWEYFDQNSEHVEGGIEDVDWFGASLAVGNFDGYGPPDLAIGVPREDGTGAVAVFYAEHTDGVHPYVRYGDQLITQNSVLDGHGVPGGAEDGDLFGWALAAGDVNGNGADDLIIGIPYESVAPDGETSHHVRAGAVVVLYGQRYDPGVDGSGRLTAVGAQMLDGWGYTSALGIALTAGDFNADALADVAAGAPGGTTNHVAVWYGSRVEHYDPHTSPLGARVEYWTQDSPGVGGVTEEGDMFGIALATGDFNGDGAADLVVGSPGEDVRAGAAHTIPGTRLDATPPVIMPHVGGEQVNGWFVGDAVVSFTITDPETPITGTLGCETQTWAVDGTQEFTCEATSLGGTARTTVVVRRDTTPPALAWLQPFPAPTADGWHNSHVSYAYSLSDGGAGVAAPAGTVVIAGEGKGRTATVTVSDAAGNEATFTSPGVNIDMTPPGIITHPNRLPTADGWNNTDVMVTPFCDDALAGVATCPAEQWATVEGETPLTFTATDRAGNTASTTRVVRIDRTPPGIFLQVIGTPSWNGWYPAATIRVTSTDALSGVPAPTSYDVPVPEGAGSTITATVFDRAGNRSTAVSPPLDVDGTPPSITVTQVVTTSPLVNGWHSAPVRVHYAAADGGSGVHPVYAAGVVEFFLESADPQTKVVEVADIAGNIGTLAVGPYRIDRSPPLLTYALSAPGPYAVGAPVTLSYTCADPQSGIDTCTGDVPSGAAIDTTTPGLHVVRLRATSVAGQVTDVDVPYVVSDPTCVPPPPGIESWWTADEDGADLLGVRPLTATGTVDVADGYVGRAFQFTDTGVLTEPLITPNLRFVGSGQSLGFALWTKPSATGGILFSRRTDYAVAVDGTGQVWMRVGGMLWHATGARLTMDQWSHVAVSLENTATAVTMRLHVNGLPAASRTYSSSAVTGGVSAQTPLLRVGGIESSYFSPGGTPPPGEVLHPPTTTGFHGAIDEMIVVRGGLTASQALDLYAAGGRGMCKALPAALSLSLVVGEEGGTVTLEARRYSGFMPLAGRTIEFLVDGQVAGTAVTGAEGVATLTVPLSALGAGAHTITARDADGGATSEPASIEVPPAVPTITVQDVAIVYGVPFDTSALLAAAWIDGQPVAGTFTYDPPHGTVLPAGTHAVSVAFTPADTTAVTAASAGAVVVVSPATATVALSALAQVYDGTPRVVTVATEPPGLAVRVGYDDTAAPPIDAGDYTVVATIDDPNYTGAAVATLRVAKATATLSLSDLEQPYDGTPRVVTVTTTPAGLPGVSVTYDGVSDAPVDPGRYAVVAALAHPNYAAAPLHATLVVTQPDPQYTLCDDPTPPFWAPRAGDIVAVRVRVCDEEGRHVSAPSLPVTAVSLTGPDGRVRPVTNAGRAGEFRYERPTGSYVLLLQTRGLPGGEHHLAVRIGDQDDEECVDVLVTRRGPGRQRHQPPHRQGSRAPGRRIDRR